MVKSSLNTSFIMAILSVAVIAILSFVSYSTFIEKPGLHWFIIAYALAASITYVNSISRGLLRLYFKFKLSSIIQMIMDVLETAMIAVAVFFTRVILMCFCSCYHHPIFKWIHFVMLLHFGN